MKYLIRTDERGYLVDFISVEQEYKYFYQEIEPLPQKDGFIVETYWDDTDKKIKQKHVEIQKTEEELTLNALKEQVRKGLDLSSMTEEELQKNIYLFDDYRQDEEYVVGSLVKHLGKLYRCKKKHKSNYESLPQLGDEFWEKINPKGKKVEQPKDVPFYSNDITYHQGDLVMYYGKVYESLEKQSGKSPEASPKTWQLK